MKKLLYLLLSISTLALGQVKKPIVKCYDYPPITNVKGDTVYAYRECGKAWTVLNPDKAIALMTANGSKLFSDYLKLTNKMDSLSAIAKKALNLSLAWMVMLNSYQLDAQHSSPAGHFRKGVDIPSAPSLTSPVTIIPTQDCCGGATYNYTLIGGVGSGGDVIPSGNFTRSPNGGFGARQWDGDATHIYRVVPAAGTILGTASGSGHGFTTIDHGNYIYLYGLSPAEPGVSKGQFGVWFPATAAGGHFYVQNWVGKSTTAGSFQANAGNGGGAYYDTVRYKFCRSFTSSQEGLYLGFTSPNYAKFNYIYVKHFFSYNSNRECLQIKGANSADISNVTSVGAGQSHTGAQDRNFQWDDSNGRLSYSVFYNGYEGAQIFSHDSRFDHLFISWSHTLSTSNILLGRTDTGAAFDYPSSRLNGDSLIFENLCIKKEGAAYAFGAFDVQNRDAPIIFRNNTLDGISYMYDDNRAVGYTNTITGTVGTQGNVTGTCPTPTFVTNYSDPDNYAVQGLLNSSDTYKLLHYGYRSP